MAGQTLSQAKVSERGIPGDRAWAIKDETRGGFKTGKRYPALMSCAARFVEEPTDTNRSATAEIEFPDGTTARTDDPNINAVLGDCVGEPVTLWPLMPEQDLEHYRRAASDPNADVEAGLRAVFARTEDEPLPDLSTFPKALFEYASPPGTYFDAYPILIMSTSALETMQSARASSNFDVRRFRPNLVIDGLASGFPENDWCGRTLTIGSVQFAIEMPCPRCIMTTHPFDDLPKDPKVMRALVQENNGNLGVYARVVKAGSLSVGDSTSVA